MKGELGPCWLVFSCACAGLVGLGQAAFVPRLFVHFGLLGFVYSLIFPKHLDFINKLIYKNRPHLIMLTWRSEIFLFSQNYIQLMQHGSIVHILNAWMLH